MNLTDRFYSKVEKTDSCWAWTGYRNKDGYGRFNFNGKNVNAHRAAWILHNGNIDKSLVVCHTCDNPSCVRLEHLFVGTQMDNVKDMMGKNRHAKTHPKRKGFKGLYQSSRSWSVKARVDNVAYHLGSFKEEYEAALAYDFFMYSIYGDKAHLNFGGVRGPKA